MVDFVEEKSASIYPTLLGCLLYLIPVGMWSQDLSVPDSIILEIRDVLVDNIFGYDEHSDHIIDSIQNQYEDSQYIQHLVYGVKAAISSYIGDYDQSIAYSLISMDYAKELLMWDEYLFEWKNLAITYQDMGQIERAQGIIDSILRHPMTAQDQELLAEIYSTQGYNYELQDDYLNALKYYELSANVIESDTTKELRINEPYSSMAIIYQSINEYDRAEEQLEKALAFNKKNPDTWINAYSIYNVWGDIYFDKGDYDQAIAYQNKSLEIIEEYLGNLDAASVDPLISIAQAYLDKEDIKALQVIDEIIEISTHTNTYPSLLIAYLLKGTFYLKGSEFNKALISCKKAEDLIDMHGVLEDRLACEECFLLAYKGLGQYQTAMTYYDEVIRFKDQLLSESKISEITEMRLTSDFERIQLQDSLSNAQNIALIEKDKQVLMANNRNIVIGLIATVFVGVLTLMGFMRVRKQNQLIEGQKQSLEELNGIKDQIFAIIGHDLRKPAIAFNGLSKKVNYLLKKKDFDGLNKLGEQIEVNGYSLQKLIDNLLNWALAQKSVLPYNPEAVKLNELFNDLLLSIQPRLIDKQITLTNQIGTKKEVWSDKSSLYTVLLNILDNAIKYTPHGGEIIVRDNLNDGRYKISIIDSGSGMTENQLNQLFLLTKNKSMKGTEGERGTGLGMHIANELVRMNKGVIEVSSQLGKGSQFDIVLPTVG